MRQYLYSSIAAPGFGQIDMIDLLEASARNNADAGITGFLLFDGRAFLQLIEGPEPALEDLMQRLGRDGRHGQITILEDLPLTTRNCPNWTMKRLRIGIAAELQALVPRSLPLAIRRKVLNFADTGAAA